MILSDYFRKFSLHLPSVVHFLATNTQPASLKTDVLFPSKPGKKELETNLSELRAGLVLLPSTCWAPTWGFQQAAASCRHPDVSKVV